LAESIRGGLQALPPGQYEAADALGLSYWRKTNLIILPQALRLVIPALVGQFITTFKDTSFVLIIGLYDLLGSTKAALPHPQWRAFYVEGYVLAALIYFVFTFSMSRYSLFLERRFGVGMKRSGDRMPDSDAIIKLDAVNKWYGAFHVLRDVSLQVKKGEKVVV